MSVVGMLFLRRFACLSAQAILGALYKHIGEGKRK